MRWSGSDEQVTGAIAILLIMAALVLISSYLWQLAHQGAGL
ncbi:MAG TPA: hypothetical protein VF502_11695 [Stellaceae bacterium]